jgi:spore maturation protein A
LGKFKVEMRKIMAMTVVWTWMIVLSVIFGCISGTLDAVTSAALDGAASAVTLCVSMAGVLCLWSGVMEVMRQSGLSEKLAHAFRPLLRRLLPNACRDAETLAAVSGNISANLLGLGNAATPLGIQAAERMAQGCNGTASNELCLLVVLNTASIQLIPATVAGVRTAAGAAAPFDILPAVWLASVLSVSAGLAAAKLLERLRGGR